jgi:putative intracellular protease/amidase
MMKIAILLYPGFTALDAIGPYEVLSRLPGARVYFVAKEKAPLLVDTGMLTVMPELTLDELPNPDILLVPGALQSFQAVMADQEVLSWIRKAHETTRWTTSVCVGSLILAAAGVLSGLEATTHWAASSMLKAFGATYSGQRVVRQGKVITAAGVSAGIDMALTLAAEWQGQAEAEAVQLLIEYDPQPPFDAGSPQKAPQAVRRRVMADLLQRT